MRILFTACFMLLLPTSLADLSPTHIVECSNAEVPPIFYEERSPVYRGLGKIRAYSFCRARFAKDFTTLATVSLGCICNLENQIECVREEATLAGQWPLRIPEYRKFCEDSCGCVDKEDSPWHDYEEEEARQILLREQMKRRHQEYLASRRRPFRGGHRQSGGGRSSSSTGSGSLNSWSLGSSYSNPQQLQSQCAATCDNQQQCSVRGLGCECKGTIVPNARSWNTYCATDWSSLLGKRDLDATACPCNSTYVSRGCCGTVDGIIWEAPELYLGTVAEDESRKEVV